MSTNIPLARPWFDAADEAAVLSTLRQGWVGQGPRVREFEATFANYTGSAHAVAVSSCTAALHLAVLAAGIGPGDEVLVPAFTWISTANAVEYAGARPIFCDVDPVTLNLDVADAARRVSPRTRGIIPVHLFGLSADMDGVAQLARAHGLTVIEDAACALGTRYRERHVGTIGEIGCFSFHPRKSITTGEGGMLTTARPELAERFAVLRDIGADRKSLTPERAAEQLLPDFPELGFNLRMTDIQGALGVTQLAKFDEILRSRFECVRRYAEMFVAKGLDEWLQLPPISYDRSHTYQAFVCTVMSDAGEPALNDAHRGRNSIMRALHERGIATRPGTHAPHMLEFYRKKYGLTPGSCPTAWRADWLTIALPLFHGLSPGDQERVCDALTELRAA